MMCAQFYGPVTIVNYNEYHARATQSQDAYEDAEVVEPSVTTADPVVPEAPLQLTGKLSGLLTVIAQSEVFVEEAHRSDYQHLWQQLLAEPLFAKAFERVTPRGFTGGYNRKLFFNIIGYLKDMDYFGNATDDSLLKVLGAMKDKIYMVYYSPSGEDFTKSASQLTPEMFAVLKRVLRLKVKG